MHSYIQYMVANSSRLDYLLTTQIRWQTAKAASQPRCRQPSSTVPVSLGRKFPLLQNGLLRQLAAVLNRHSLSAAGTPRPHLCWTWQPRDFRSFSSHLSLALPRLPLPCLYPGATPHTHTTCQHVQARPQSSCGFGLRRAKGKSAPFLSYPPETSRALKPRCSGHIG